MKQRTQILLISLALVGLWIWRKRDSGSMVPDLSDSLDGSGTNFRAEIKPEKGSPKQPDLNYQPTPKPEGVLSREIAASSPSRFDAGATAQPVAVSRETPIVTAISRAANAVFAPTATRVSRFGIR